MEKGILIGLEKGRKETAEETAVKLLRSRWLNREKLDELDEKLKSV